MTDAATVLPRPNDGTDQSAALNAFLLAAKGQEATLKPGAYVLNAATVIHAGTYLHARGVRLIAGPGLLREAVLLWNNTQFATAEDRDQDIVIDGLTADGAGLLRPNGLICLISPKNAMLRNVRCVNVQGPGLVLAYYDGVTVDDYNCTKIGRDADDEEGSAGLFLQGQPGFGARGATINRLRADDLFCASLAIVGNVAGTIVNDIRSSRTVGCGIYHEEHASGTQFHGGMVTDVKRRRYSGSGIEAGGNLSVLGMDIRRTANGSIDLMDAWDWSVSECHLENAGQDDYPGFAKAALIQHLATPLGKGLGGRIGCNTLRQKDRSRVAPIRFAAQAGAMSVDDVTICRQGTDGVWTDGVVRVMSTAFGKRCLSDEALRTY